MFPRIYSAEQELSRHEKITLISSIMSGIGKEVYFDQQALENRIKECLQTAEKML